MCKKVRCYLEKFTQLTKILHDRRSRRSRQIPSLLVLTIYLTPTHIRAKMIDCISHFIILPLGHWGPLRWIWWNISNTKHMNVRKVEKTIRLEKAEFFVRIRLNFNFLKRSFVAKKWQKKCISFTPLPKHFYYSRFYTFGNATHKSST